jgi:hypothetical protein
VSEEEEDEFEGTKPPEDWTARLLKFWFDEHVEADWFGGGPEFDAKVTEHFAGWSDTLRGHLIEAFVETAEKARSFCSIKCHAMPIAGRQRRLPPIILHLPLANGWWHLVWTMN